MAERFERLYARITAVEGSIVPVAISIQGIYG